MIRATLEELLARVLRLAMIPDGSAKFAQWHNAGVAEDSYFWTRGSCEHQDNIEIALKICKERSIEGLTSPSPYVRRLTQLSLLEIGSGSYLKQREEFIIRASIGMMNAMTEAKWTEESRRLTDDFFRKGLDKSLRENGL